MEDTDLLIGDGYGRVGPNATLDTNRIIIRLPRQIARTATAHLPQSNLIQLESMQRERERERKGVNEPSHNLH